jgi:long-chain acyl-CoA synthetase
VTVVSRTDPAYTRPSFDTVVDMLWHAVETASDRAAILEGDRSLSYGEFGAAAAALARDLIALNVGGERVAVLLPTSIEANIAIFATLAAGAQVTMLNPGYTERELAPLLADAAPRALITLSGTDADAAKVAASLGIDHVLTLGAGDLTLERLLARGATPPRVAIDPDNYATLMYTGGTTGVPKGVERSHRQHIMTVAAMHAAWPTRDAAETWLNVAPVFHIWGFLMGCMNPVYGRNPVVVVARFKPDTVVEAIEAHRVTVFSGGPAAIYVGLLGASSFASADLSSLRLCPGGGSPFLLETLIGWEKATGVPILEAFGMTEAGPITANPIDGTHRNGSVGMPLEGIELEIVDLDDPTRCLPTREVGEIRIRGPRVIADYRGLLAPPATNSEHKWLMTGDIGYIDDHGFLHLVDRKKDMLIVGGFNVYPREIEEVLVQHPAVCEAAVVGIVDTRKGEVPTAFVVLHPNSAVDQRDLLAYCAERLVSYKQPRDVIVVDALPKTPANKLDRKELIRRAGR